MNDVNKKTITETIAETYNFTKKEAAEIVDMVFETMAAALENGDRVAPDEKITLFVGGHQPDKVSNELLGYECERIEL